MGHALGLSALLALAAAVMNVLALGPLERLPALLGPQLQQLMVQLTLALAVTTPLASAMLHQRALLGRLRESEARYRLLADHSTDIILSTAPDGTIRFVSPSIRQLFAADAEALIGTSALALVVPEHRPLVTAAQHGALGDPGRVETVEFLGLTSDGATHWFESNLRAVRGPQGSVDLVVSIIRDITERKAVEDALAQAALTDPLTGLANRRHFEAELARAIASGREGCVALIDLDHFKRVNDSFGHAAGDAVLRTFARVARAGLRGTDLLARVGGEEFALLLPGAGMDVAEMVCGRLGAALSRTATPFGNARIVITTSIGLAPISTSAEHCMNEADRALYEAKAAGRDRLSVAA